MRLESLKPGDLFTFASAQGEPFFVTHESEPPYRMVCRRWAAWHDNAQPLPSSLPVTRLTRKQAKHWYDQQQQSPRPPKHRLRAWRV